ncbi:hypothetical protein N658DRAFT_484351 [Parathielavia hyrcaniae]|uniref:Infection structure specific protein n=1 Tax=Parathielavia hyrcaniae TaxID=113614 RepID=A0AAN6Q4H7_9PEZI|nr:hypothetical protein N658DRAFT_484351 [Parathielavia hyrcaniae]
MHSQTLLLSLAGVAAAGHIQVRRDVVARQTDVDMSECAEAVMSLITDLPPVPTEFAEMTWMACTMTVPPALESVYSSYMSEYSSWHAENGDAFSSAMAMCPELPGVDADDTECTETAGDNAGGPTGSPDSDSGDAEETGSGSESDMAAPTGTGTAAEAGASATSTAGSGSAGGSGSGTSGAHRDMGIVGGAAVALAGFLGVIALL